MTRLVAVVATFGVGALVAFQPPVNAALARHMTVITAAFVSVTVSAVALGLLVLVTGQYDRLGGVTGVPLTYLTGGLLGAALVSVSLVTVRKLGAGGVVAATVAGQLFVSLLIDRAGLLGLHPVGFTAPRVLGFALVVVGTFIAVR